MFRIALKSIVGRKARLVLTSLAVILGTAFLSGTSVFSATLDRTFNNLFEDVFKNIDGYVRSTQVVEGDFGLIERQRIPADYVDKVLSVPGVSDAVPDIQAFARIVGKDGKPIGTEGAGPPTFGSVAVEFKGALWTIAEGKFPKGPTEVALDEASAEKAGYVLGDKVKVVAQSGSRTFTLVGIASYGDVRSPGGATFALFDVPTAAEFLGKPGFVDAILVVGDGSRSDDALAKDIDAIFEPSQKVETLTGAEITKETQDDIGQALSFFSIFLTIFSVIALGVGSFVIYNVFSISAAQRQKENALLRALGANRAQITRSMLIESIVVGLFGSLLGFVGGIGISKLLSVALPALGFDLPSGGLVISASILINTVIVGLVVTVLSAVLPARRAGKVPPLAAMRATAIETAGPGRVRLFWGLGSMLVGLGIIGAVIGGSSNNLLGFGVLFVFIGTIVIGPSIARPVALFLGRPAETLRGVTGQMARQNAARNPKRTSRTSAPVLIGVALVTAVSALAASINGQIADIFTEQFKGDYAVNSNAQGFGGLSPDLATTLSSIDGVNDASGIGTVLTKINDKGRTLIVITPSSIGGNYDIGLVNADYSVLDKDGILISESLAERDNLKIGSVIPVTFGDGVTRDLTVRALYVHNDLAGDRVISRETFANTTVSSFDFSIYVTLEKGADNEKVRAELQKAVDEYGQGKLLSRDEYIDEQAGQVNQLLGLIYGLLALSVIIAIVGIIITLLLSVFERQREIGLLRAVGMTRSQVRTTVRWESVITSLLGAVVGILLGLGLGWVIVFALRDQGLTSFQIPVGSTVFIMVMSFVVGVLAAVYPAWRATKVDMLDALNTN
ncbi:MAG: FtsX-like permease family protein [Ilumatobacteraceae bacterium]|jgi:putative ABC transport system permease protein|nr:FtsX-like permease family protein [Ilumatobacteraceae bacterium]